jgi:hypothetical protein
VTGPQVAADQLGYRVHLRPGLIGDPERIRELDLVILEDR